MVIYSKKKNGRYHYKEKPLIVEGSLKYRWKQLGFTSNIKYQEFLNLFKLPFCAKCGMSNILHIKAFGFRLTIDHIDNNRYNNRPENLQTLCAICHYLKDESFQSHFIRMLTKNKKYTSMRAKKDFRIKYFEKLKILLEYRSLYF